MNPLMVQLPAEEAYSYPIQVGFNLLENPDLWLEAHLHHKKLVIITDDNVKHLYGEKLSHALSHYQPLLLSFLPGEQSKNYHTKQFLDERLLQNYCNRETLILALGGGVVGDVAGYVASTYMRGVPYIQIPTTLLAMVDSSVGGKTSINTSQGKNLIGTFWQPSGVVADINCLMTLPLSHMIMGFVEALKMFMTNDVTHFNYARNHIDSILNKDVTTLKIIIENAIKIKVDTVNHDEKENHRRMVLNFGHTIGHALEKVTQYSLLHGYAVALGILVESKISELLGFISSSEYQMIQSLFYQLNISGEQLKKINHCDIIQATKNDKKMKSTHVRYVLLEKIGKVYIDDNNYAHPVPENIIIKAFNEVCEA